uniref:Secreted protein n=1 Tax=Caenorhabditis tropicalis TaxID=1561998 RepID=A0A1I7UCB6_9PELO
MFSHLSVRTFCHLSSSFFASLLRCHLLLDAAPDRSPFEVFSLVELANPRFLPPTGDTLNVFLIERFLITPHLVERGDKSAMLTGGHF